MNLKAMREALETNAISYRVANEFEFRDMLRGMPLLSVGEPAKALFPNSNNDDPLDWNIVFPVPNPTVLCTLQFESTDAAAVAFAVALADSMAAAAAGTARELGTTAADESP